MDTCTWEPRDTPGVKETNLDSQFLIDSVVETTTAKRSNEGVITEFNPTNKKFKMTHENGKSAWKNLNKPDKNHSWGLVGFTEDELRGGPQQAESESESSSSTSSNSGSNSESNDDNNGDNDDDSNADIGVELEATQEMIQPPSDEE